MNATHFHLMFNHLPIVGLGFAILLNLLAVFGKSPEVKRLSCWFYIFIGLLAILPIATGDGAREILLTHPGISKDAIENHETFAYIFFYGLILNGVLAIGTLWFSRKKPDLMKKLNIAMLIVSLVVSVFAYQAGTTGGKIRHSEIEQGIYKK
jgi:uncharacterized membrane protein